MSKQLTELEQKRQQAKVVLQELKAIIKKHGFEAVNYCWNKVIKVERELTKARQEVEAAQKREQQLKRELEEV